MSILGSYSFLGGYGPLAQAVTTLVEPTEKAKPSDPLDRESVVYGMPSIGFDKAPPGSASLYWQMRRYSACALAYAVTAGPVFAGTRTATIRNADESGQVMPTGVGVQVTQTPEEKRRKATEDVFEDQWPDILNGLEAYNFGNWLQEVIWGSKAGLTAPVRFKSFLPSEAQLLRDKYNDFAGFRHGRDERDVRYAFLSVCQPHFDPIFGSPRAENARLSWWRAVQSHENGDKIERKASGIQMWLEMPTGASWVDSSGNAVLKRDAVQTIVNAAASGATFTTPIPWTKDDIKAKPELAEIPLVRIKEFDWGETGPALTAAIARLDRLDKEIFRAWHRPEREAMEGLHGTKAEAGVHGQVGITDSEKVHSDFLRQFNKQVVNRFLVTNWGPDAADTIYFKPAPLADPQQTFKQDVATALLNSPTAGPQMQANVDGRRLLKETEVPLLPEGAVPTVAMPPEPDQPPDDVSPADDA
jgi:hypothetical protein